jgi:hypothetical protein
MCVYRKRPELQSTGFPWVYKVLWYADILLSTSTSTSRTLRTKTRRQIAESMSGTRYDPIIIQDDAPAPYTSTAYDAPVSYTSAASDAPAYTSSAASPSNAAYTFSARSATFVAEAAPLGSAANPIVIDDD